MSWDIFTQDIPPEAGCVDEIPADFVPAELGSRDDLIDRIRRVAPSVDFSDPAWGNLETPELSVEFNMGHSRTLTSFALHLRGGDLATGFVSDLLEHLGLRALDPQSVGGILAPGVAAAENVLKWRTYRDSLLG